MNENPDLPPYIETGFQVPYTGKDIFDMLLNGMTPKFLPCGNCSALSTWPVCWDCCKDERLRKDMRWLYRECGLPESFYWATFDSPKLRERVKLSNHTFNGIQETADRSNKVVFFGNKGTGKTSLAVALLRRRVPRCYYIRAERLARVSIEHPAGRGEPETVTRCKQAALLMVDDIGTDEQTKTSAVKDVIFHRHDAGLPTWVTTGLQKGAIGEMYGEGFARRLIENAVLVKCGQ